MDWERHDRIRPDFDGKRPMLFIPGSQQKSGKDSITPITPDFANHLGETPQGDRCGPVYALPTDHRARASLKKTMHLVSAIGEKAGVVVNAEKSRTASAHDLRRSFGFRWSRKAMPAVLQELMRHATINTTMQYYVGQNAEATAELLWESQGNISGNNCPESEPPLVEKSRPARI